MNIPLETKIMNEKIDRFIPFDMEKYIRGNLINMFQIVYQEGMTRAFQIERERQVMGDEKNLYGHTKGTSRKIQRDCKKQTSNSKRFLRKYV